MIPALLAGFAACFALGVLTASAVILHWLRPRWESAAWWKTAPETTREAIGRHARQAAAGLEDQAVTDVLAAVPRIRAHEPPGIPASTPQDDQAGWLERELASLREWTHRLTRGGTPLWRSRTATAPV